MDILPKDLVQIIRNYDSAFNYELIANVNFEIKEKFNLPITRIKYSNIWYKIHFAHLQILKFEKIWGLH
jgi:hypothetical protein